MIFLIFFLVRNFKDFSIDKEYLYSKFLFLVRDIEKFPDPTKINEFLCSGKKNTVSLSALNSFL